MEFKRNISPKDIICVGLRSKFIPIEKEMNVINIYDILIKLGWIIKVDSFGEHNYKIRYFFGRFYHKDHDLILQIETRGVKDVENYYYLTIRQTGDYQFYRVYFQDFELGVAKYNNIDYRTGMFATDKFGL